MSKCENCCLRKESAKAFDIHWHDEMDCPYATCPVPDFPKTNADRIRTMTDEELAAFMEDTATWGGCPNRGARDCTSDCGMCWISWLKSPVEVDDG